MNDRNDQNRFHFQEIELLPAQDSASIKESENREDDADSSTSDTDTARDDQRRAYPSNERGFDAGAKAAPMAFATPEEYAEYWKDFDGLTADLRSDWLLEYMRRAWTALSGRVRSDLTEHEIQQALSEHHEDLVAAWVGTVEQPGPLLALALGGMAAADRTLETGRAAKPPAAKASLLVDWNLLASEALEWAQRYSYKLIKDIDQQTVTAVSNAVSTAIAQGIGIEALTRDLNDIFNDERRARLIAQTEAIRAYNQGAFARWDKAGVTEATWRTVNDSNVCDLCKRLNGQTAKISEGWFDSETDKTYYDSAHVQCRCFRQPVVSAQPFDTSTISDLLGKADETIKLRNDGEFKWEPVGPAPVPKPKPAPKPKPEQKEIKPQPVPALSYKEVLKQREADLRKVKADQKAREQKLRDETDKRVREIWDKKSDLTLKRDALGDSIDDLDRQISSERDKVKQTELMAKRTKLVDEYLDLSDKTRQQLDEMDKQVTALRVNRDEALSKLDTGQKRSAPTFVVKSPAIKKDVTLQSSLDAGQQWLSRIFNGDRFNKQQLEINVERTSKKRSFFKPGEATIAMSKGEFTAVVIHEWGHAIEDGDPELHRRCIEFLESRAESLKPVTLRKLTGNKSYASHEVAYKDKFPDPYVGKVYQNSAGEYYATEILSMGLEAMYKDPVKFEQEDPEYYDFILAITRGYF